jgi:hypothetical protein
VLHAFTFKIDERLLPASSRSSILKVTIYKKKRENLENYMALLLFLAPASKGSKHLTQW